MGHRALIAYHRTDGTYSLHYSHWGAANLKLKHQITGETPFGGEDTDSNAAKQLLTALTEGLDAEAVGGYLADDQRPSTLVNPQPIATGLTLSEIITEQLDYLHHEAFFRVSTEMEVTAYRTFWFGLQYDCDSIEDGDTVGNGALATVYWYDGEPVGDGSLRGRFNALKDITGDLIDAEIINETEAKGYFVQKLDKWVSDDQEFICPIKPSKSVLGTGLT